MENGHALMYFWLSSSSGKFGELTFHVDVTSKALIVSLKETSWDPDRKNGSKSCLDRQDNCADLPILGRTLH